jgi:hypothetical protein
MSESVDLIRIDLICICQQQYTLSCVFLAPFFFSEMKGCDRKATLSGCQVGEIISSNLINKLFIYFPLLMIQFIF